MAIEASRLVGSWHLTEWSVFVDGEPAGHPMGPDAVGQLVYTDDGIMSAILHTATRPAFGTLLFAQGTGPERDAAALTYLSYGGTYDVRGDEVHHCVSHSLFPDWVGTDLVRTVSWEDDDLVLVTPLVRTRSGKQVVNRVKWRRTAPLHPRAPST